LSLVCAGVARYNVLIKAIVVKEYEAIACKRERRRILWTISALSREPRPVEAKKLPEREDHLRICLGHYRVLYGIDDLKRRITVFRIAKHRRQYIAG
jgi:mRNA-degrading endonuclease RelE of RelBE toxin-antitoxin system